MCLGDYVLVIEKYEKIGEMLERVIKDMGYRAETEVDANKALEQIVSSKPALIILDFRFIKSEEISITFIKCIAKNQSPIIITSAYSEFKELVMLKEQMPSRMHFLNKPFDLDELRFLISGFLDK